MLLRRVTPTCCSNMLLRYIAPTCCTDELLRRVDPCYSDMLLFFHTVAHFRGTHWAHTGRISHTPHYQITCAIPTHIYNPISSTQVWSRDHPRPITTQNRSFFMRWHTLEEHTGHTPAKNFTHHTKKLRGLCLHTFTTP